MIIVVQASLLVLAGGGSRRMGRPKAWLAVGEGTLLSYVVQRLAPEFSEVIISFAEPEQLLEPVPYRIVFDRKVAAGPLAGLEAGLAAAKQDLVFAIACDMPYVTPEVAQLAVAAARGSDAAIPRIEGRAEPACGAYARSALPSITRALNEGRFRAADVAAELEVTWLEGLDPGLFRSLNAPADLERLNAELSAQR